MGATDCEVVVSSSLSESVSLRNKQIDHSESSNNLSVAITTYINKKIKCILIKYKWTRFNKINRKIYRDDKSYSDDPHSSMPDKNKLLKNDIFLNLFDETSISTEKNWFSERNGGRGLQK